MHSTTDQVAMNRTVATDMDSFGGQIAWNSITIQFQ